MECPKCLDRISEYIDGELDESENKQVRGHLLTCQDCQNLAQEFQLLHNSLNQALETIPVPVDLDQRILISLRQEQKKVNQQRVFSFFLLVLMASPLLLIFPVLLRIVHFFYVAGYAFWRAKDVLIMLLPVPISWGIGATSILLCIIGIYMIRTLLQGGRIKEVSL